MTVDLNHLTPADVDDLFRRVAAGEDPAALAAEAERLRRAHLLAASTTPTRTGGSDHA